MLVIIDYGMGNIASIKNALDHLGASYKVSKDHQDLKKADKLILPGVGSFRKAMQNLEQQNLIGILNEKVMQQKVPVLGICLGMQLLADAGEEDAGENNWTPGLGWIPGTVSKITTSASERIPHMGFNEIQIARPHSLIQQIPANSHFYFVHSYQFEPAERSAVIATTDYGQGVVAIVGRENISGVQFHPEKSQQVGLQLIKNFLAGENNA